METTAVPLWRKVSAIASRLVVGVTFVVSGFAKSIDPAGFVFKIEDYLQVWNIPLVHVLDVSVAFIVSIAEFVLGAMLLLGCYRRVVPWLVTGVMAFMLPLTLYIWLEDPVADCGCFGDMLVISNFATFLKNVVLSVMIVLLLMCNRSIAPSVRPDFQWIACALSAAYAFMIAFIGYNYQPLIDFRPYPVGTSLVVRDSGGTDTDDYSFIYEKDGERCVFPIDSLPDDSWTFVERSSVGHSNDRNTEEAGTIVLYNESGDDVTGTTIDSDGDQLLVLIPDAASTGYSRAHLIRSFNKAMESRGGRMTVVVAGDDDYTWRDHVGRGLDVVTAEDTSIKELARGEIALVYLSSGIIRWKLDATSLPTDYLDTASFSRAYPLGRLAVNSARWLWGLTALYVCSIVLLIVLPWIMAQIIIAKQSKKA